MVTSILLLLKIVLADNITSSVELDLRVLLVLKYFLECVPICCPAGDSPLFTISWFFSTKKKCHRRRKCAIIRLISKIQYRFLFFSGQRHPGAAGDEAPQRRRRPVPQVRPSTWRGGVQVQRRIPGELWFTTSVACTAGMRRRTDCLTNHTAMCFPHTTLITI